MLKSSGFSGVWSESTSPLLDRGVYIRGVYIRGVRGVVGRGVDGELVRGEGEAERGVRGDGEP